MRAGRSLLGRLVDRLPLTHAHTMHVRFFDMCIFRNDKTHYTSVALHMMYHLILARDDVVDPMKAVQASATAHGWMLTKKRAESFA